MVLNSLLVLDANSLMESATALWTVIGVAGGISILNVLTFVRTAVSGKKFKNVSDFAVVADQSIKFAKKEIKELKNEIVDETMEKVVNPLKEQVQTLVSSNTQLSSVVVSLLSYIPLPLEIKKDAVSVIGTLGNITDEARALLASSLAYQEKQEAIEQEKDTELKDDIGNI